MAASIFDFTSRLNPKLLAERMYRQQWRQNKFAQWVAPEFIKRGGKGEEVGTLGMDTPNFSGAPIEVFEQFVKMGRTDMDIPVRNRLIGDPVFGDAPLKGTAEAAVVAFRQILINQTRKAYAPPTGMSKQITKAYAENLINQADAYIRQWWNDYHPGNFILTMLAGASLDVVAPTTLSGRGLSYVSHPNLVVAGSGLVTYGAGRPGTAGFEGSVETALNGMADDPKYYMSVNLIRNLVVEAARLRIGRVALKNGFEFYPLWISDAAWVQLQNDPEFKDFYKRLPEGLAKHPVATGAESFIQGAAIYPDLSLWGARTNALDGDVTAGTVEYGPKPTAGQRGLGRKVGTWTNQLDVSDIKMALLIGQSAMAVGVGEKISFTDQLDDHGAVQEIGIKTIQSVVRSDVYDRDGKVPGLSAGDFYENTSSLAVATFSKHTLKY
jgi:hypothetical protein